MWSLITAIGGNVTSIILWFPQVRTTWHFRHNKNALSGLSYYMIYFGIFNTLFWGMNGILTKNLGLAFGTLFILPSTLVTLVLKYRAEHGSKEELNMNDEYKHLTQEGYLMNVVKSALNNCDLMRDITDEQNIELSSIIDELERTNQHALEELKKYPKYKNVN